MAEPFYVIERDGVTQGLLSLFLDCREKARIFLKGYSLKSTNLGLTFGTIVHTVLDGVYSDIRAKRLTRIPTPDEIKRYTARAEAAWKREHPVPTPIALEHLEHALLLSELVLPIYFDVWRKDLQQIAWTGLEQNFSIPYQLRDGRKTLLRGKMDGDFLRNKYLWLFETKTKSQINEATLVDRLPFDLQVNFYLYGLRRLKQQLPSGVWYNLIRRPGLRQREQESVQQFAERCVEDIRLRPTWYFMRLELAITAKELDRWEGEFEDLLKDFYDWWQGKSGHYKNPNQCETKYGQCDYLPICAGQRMAAYYKRAVVFRELEDY